MAIETEKADASVSLADLKAHHPPVKALALEGILVNRHTAWKLSVSGRCGVLLRRWWIDGRWWSTREAAREFKQKVEEAKAEEARRTEAANGR